MSTAQTDAERIAQLEDALRWLLQCYPYGVSALAMGVVWDMPVRHALRTLTSDKPLAQTPEAEPPKALSDPPSP